MNVGSLDKWKIICSNNKGDLSIVLALFQCNTGVHRCLDYLKETIFSIMSFWPKLPSTQAINQQDSLPVGFLTEDSPGGNV